MSASVPTALHAALMLPNGATLPNRLAKAAMTEGLADPLGVPTDDLVRLYGAWSGSGCGVLVTGNVQIDRWHLERPGNVIIDRAPDAVMRRQLRQWARAAQAKGSKIWMQISHAGRQTQATVNEGAFSDPARPARQAIRHTCRDDRDRDRGCDPPLRHRCSGGTGSRL